MEQLIERTWAKKEWVWKCVECNREFVNKAQKHVNKDTEFACSFSNSGWSCFGHKDPVNCRFQLCNPCRNNGLVNTTRSPAAHGQQHIGRKSALKSGFLKPNQLAFD